MAGCSKRGAAADALVAPVLAGQVLESSCNPIHSISSSFTHYALDMETFTLCDQQISPLRYLHFQPQLTGRRTLDFLRSTYLWTKFSHPADDRLYANCSTASNAKEVKQLMTQDARKVEQEANLKDWG